MKVASTATVDAVKNDVAVFSATRVYAEWNMNRYSNIESITNNGVEDFDADIFPIDSIALPNRPKAGILKSRVAEINRTNGIGADGYVSAGYKDIVNGPRYVTGSVDSKYKYWTSPSESAGTLYQNTPSAISDCNPQINYADPVWTNKIVIGVENSYSAPSAWSVEITSDGTNWDVIDTNSSLDADGRLVIYRQANGTWATTQYLEAPVQIVGIRVNVTQMNKSRVHFNLIEISPRLENDLTDFVVEWDARNTMSDHSFVAPLGKASSNGGSVTLSNIDARFSNDNASSLYYGLLDKGVKFTIDMGVTTDSWDTVSKSYEYMRMATMYSDDWTGQDRDGTNVELVDGSEYLKGIKPNPMYLENKTAGEIIWRLLDSVGFTDYHYEKGTDESAFRVPYFWADGEDTVWKTISDICEAMQMAAYFDEYGILQIRTPRSAYNTSNSVSWEFDAITNGSKLSDIIEFNKSYDYEANTVNVRYANTDVSEFNNGNPAMEVIWEPEDSEVLRSTALYQTITSASTSIKLSPEDAKYWPYQGVFQMNGEFMRYTKKEYAYYDAGGSLQKKYIESVDEKDELDRLNQYISFKNYFTGLFYVPLQNRGLWNTVPKSHFVDANGYLARYKVYTSAVQNWAGGMSLNRGESTLTLTGPTYFDWRTFYVVSRGSTSDHFPYYSGTRLKFESDTEVNCAGLALSLSTNDSGYYVELRRTSGLTAENLTTSYELCFYVRYSNGTFQRFGPNGGRGMRVNVATDVWYDLDVTMATSGASRVFSIFLNGQKQFNVTVGSTSAPVDDNSGRFGIFNRARGRATFEYLYASTNYKNGVLEDDATVFDRITGGYQSNQLVGEWGYRITDYNRFSSVNPNTAIKDIYANFFFDDFGSVAHEVREYDVKFNKTPVQHSRIYFSNESQVICPEYRSDPFGAQFILGNKSRYNAVVSGEDTLTFGADNSVDQKCVIYGRVVTQDEDEVVTVKDEAGIRRRGEAALDIESEWIQSESAAQAIADWIVEHWGKGCDEVELDVFGNPFIQIGDIVSVNHPVANVFAATHKYFVVEIKNQYSNGLTTSVVLRRANI